MHKPPNRSRQAYVSLRERIASGELAPGSVVSEASLAKELGLSRTPIGEALRRLSHEGLVEQVPRYGTIVKQVSSEELIELFEVREALEGMAAAKAAQRISDDAIAELRTLCDKITEVLSEAEAAGHDEIKGEALRRFLSADLALHMLIIASAGNRRLYELAENTRSLSSTFTARRGVHSIERIRGANDMHRRIVDALSTRDGGTARELIVLHIQTSCRQSLDHHAARPPVSLGTINLPDSVRQDLADEIR